jgi:hypothetical protein
MTQLITVSHISIGEPIKSATSIYTYKRYTLIATDGKDRNGEKCLRTVV